MFGCRSANLKCRWWGARPLNVDLTGARNSSIDWIPAVGPAFSNGDIHVVFCLEENDLVSF